MGTEGEYLSAWHSLLNYPTSPSLTLPPLLPPPSTHTHHPQITPGLGVIAALLVFFVVKEPARGHGDGQRSRSSKGVRGKSGFMAYMHDVWYCLRV